MAASSLAAARLSPTSYAVLALVALRGPSTPYELERALGRVASQFWSVPHTQCYTETDRLATAGWLSVTAEDAGRRRRRYALTPAGQQVVRDWLAEPTPASMEVRDVAQLKLLCGELGNPADIVALARLQVASYRERLEQLADVERRFEDRPDLALRMAPARLGRRVYEVALEFWQDIADHPPQPPSAGHVTSSDAG